MLLDGVRCCGHLAGSQAHAAAYLGAGHMRIGLGIGVKRKVEALKSVLMYVEYSVHGFN